MPRSIFLCHSSRDKEFARRLYTDLRARGQRVWLDEAEMRVGDSLIGKLEAAIDDVDYLAVILSDHSVQSEWVLREMRMAMHREISGKRVFVLPLLYKDCKLPGFLRDKIYVDFRRESNYEQGISEMIRRCAGDLSNHPELKDSFEAIEELPFTRAWRIALNTGNLSNKFSLYIKSILGSMSAEEGTWHPGIAISYILFLTEIIQRNALNKESWSFLCRIVEDGEINLFLRYTTLDRMLPAGYTLIEKGICALPKLESKSKGTSCENLFDHCMQSYFDPTAYDSDTMDSATPIRILSFFWRFGDQSFRKALLRKLESFIKPAGKQHLHIIDPLRQLKDGADITEIEDILIDLRNAWVRLEDSDYAQKLGKKAGFIIQNLVQQQNVVNPEEIVDLFRHASALEEAGDFSLYLPLIRIFAPRHFTVVRERQGDAFTYRLLVALTVDQYIEVSLSYFALQAIVMAFGPEALLLDDTLIESLFTPKLRGQFHGRLIDIACETLASEENKDDDSDMIILLAIHSALGPDHREELMSTIKKHATESQRVSLLGNYLSEQITWEEFIAALNKK